jgi:hypothetical protein
VSAGARPAGARRARPILRIVPAVSVVTIV